METSFLGLKEHFMNLGLELDLQGSLAPGQEGQVQNLEVQPDGHGN